MTTESTLFLVAMLAAVVSIVGIFDALITWSVFERSQRAWDFNARVLARAGIRTAMLRTFQMLGILIVADVATRIQPRPTVDAELHVAWVVLIVVCLISATKELLAMWDRRHIVPDAQPPKGWH